MPHYFDPITLENTPVIDTSTIYLVKSDAQSFVIRGISMGIEQLASDPLTHAKIYWLVPIENLLNEFTKKHLFDEDDNLITRPLNLDEVVQYLKIDPSNIQPQEFSSSIGQALNNTWAMDTTQSLLASGATNAGNIFGFYWTAFNQLQDSEFTTEEIIIIANSNSI